MILSKSQKILVGFLTLLPFVMLPYFLFKFFTLALRMAEYDGRADEEEILYVVLSFILPIIIMTLLSIGLLIFYIVHLIKNKNLDNNERIIWVLLFVFLGLFAFPIYFFLKITGKQGVELGANG